MMDTMDMKKEIRELREKKSALEKEKSTLEVELAKLESKEATLRQEYNVVGAIHELNVAERYSGGDDTIDKGASVTRDKGFEKRFDELNKKMEIQTLTSALKQALPALEAEALRWEGQIHFHEKEAKIMEDENNSIPANILKTKSSLETELGDILEARIIQKATFAREIDVAMKQKRSLADELKQRRLIVGSIDGDMWSMKFAALRAKLALLEEEVKISELLREQSILREEIGAFHKEGWQAEAFIMHCGTMSGLLSVEEVSLALRQWLPFSVDCTIPVVTKSLQLCQGPSGSGFVSTTEKRINFSLFLSICEFLVNESLPSAR